MPLPALRALEEGVDTMKFRVLAKRGFIAMPPVERRQGGEAGPVVSWLRDFLCEYVAAAINQADRCHAREGDAELGHALCRDSLHKRDHVRVIKHDAVKVLLLEGVQYSDGP